MTRVGVTAAICAGNSEGGGEGDVVDETEDDDAVVGAFVDDGAGESGGADADTGAGGVAANDTLTSR